MPDLILHHYDASPYSEKIRLLLGYKQLTWHSVQMPPVLPKPDLMKLTHGYRRAPVLQIGADLYCDSSLIAQELEQRFPTPALASGAPAAQAALLSQLVDVTLFWQGIHLLMGKRAAQIPQALLDDRIRMHPQMDLDRDHLAANVPHLSSQLTPVLSMLDQALSASPWLGGDLPAIGDFGVYQLCWFLHKAGWLDELVPVARHLPDWMARMAAWGQGQRSELTADAALAIALAAAPQALPTGGDEGELRIGNMVSVMPEHYPQEAVQGQLRYLDTQRVTLQLEHTDTGTLHIHFPRLGYQIQSQA
ncbi:glutathione S-transferase family protein [Leeia sp.]|uniref:glutathione S-transferase family protein n=1 Tax=Leeia sp. TaxID=2884678 RepID=UPI0035AE1D5C